MIGPIAMAVLAGVLIGLSRQVNGRLSLSKGALGASFWNHLVGALALVAAVLALWVGAGGPLWPTALSDVPAFAWAGGALGVVFVASGSWLVSRIGAANTALLVIAGQMVTGALLDTLRGAEGAPIRALGVAVILGGVALRSKG
ncbi:DMT family transporter [Rubellimicrobium arenae]|uniref:DMT family transporter n=1 Tax=Rubellimicrobium arenae TaxID=2817372 RepID=UPI001B31425A|nr:DMT family transporter [Rubellimicrobium arenae]